MDDQFGTGTAVTTAVRLDLRIPGNGNHAAFGQQRLGFHGQLVPHLARQPMREFLARRGRNDHVDLDVQERRLALHLDEFVLGHPPEESKVKFHDNFGFGWFESNNETLDWLFLSGEGGRDIYAAMRLSRCSGPGGSGKDRNGRQQASMLPFPSFQSAREGKLLANFRTMDLPNPWASLSRNDEEG